MSNRNKIYAKVVGNTKNVSYRLFAQLMRAYGYVLQKKRRGSSHVAFVLDPSLLGRAEADFQGLESIKLMTVAKPHPATRRVDPRAVKHALDNIDYIRSMTEEAESRG